MSGFKQEHFFVDGKEHVVKVCWFDDVPDCSGKRHFWISRLEIERLPIGGCVGDVMRLIFPGLVFFRCARRGCCSHPGYWGAVAGSRREGEKEGAAIRQAGPLGPCEAGGERSVPRPTPTGQTSKAKSPG